MLKLCLTVILLGCVTQINCENLPVFIWGQKTPNFLPALSQLSGDEFVTLVKSQTDKETLTVVFVENSLSVEDLSQCKLKTETCFENLRKIEDKTYLTSVEDPVKALESLYSEHKQKSVSLTNDGDLSDKVDAAGSEKLLFVYLDDVERNEDFAKHDELMSKLYNSIASKRENVIAIYTARHPSFVYSKPLIRKVREAAEEAKPEAVSSSEVKPEAAKPVDAKPQQSRQEGQPEQHVTALPNFLIALSGFKFGDEAVPASSVVVSVNQTTDNQGRLEVNFDAGAHGILGMVLELSAGSWSARLFTLGEVRFFPQVPVNAYQSKSFGCGLLRLSSGSQYIDFENVQMQPKFHPDEDVSKFSDAVNDCVGFFSPGIWGALFVVFILVSILTIGLTMIMDIKTMDRFDDPKGKTITINAQE